MGDAWVMEELYIKGIPVDIADVSITYINLNCVLGEWDDTINYCSIKGIPRMCNGSRSGKFECGSYIGNI